MPMPWDVMDLEEEWTDEERLARDSVRRFVDAEVRPHVARWWREGTAPALLPALGKLGILGATLDLDGGGPTMGAVAYGLAMKELERGDSCIRSIVGVQSNLSMFPIWRFGSAHHHEKYLDKMRTGALSGCFCLSEPDAGSDPGAMRTRATKTDNGWVINGVKRWITAGTTADVAIVWAKTGEGARSIRAFAVDTDAPGLVREKILNKQSFRASDTAELTFDDVRVTEDALLPKSEGLKSALEVLSHGRFGISWGALGAAEDCLATALAFVADRPAFGRPLAGFQLVQKKLADASAALTSAQLIAFRLGRLKEKREAEGRSLDGHQVSTAKMVCVKTALDIARTCRDILGANGIMDDYPVMRHLANLETVYTYEGTHDVHTLVLGAAITGHGAFR